MVQGIDISRLVRSREYREALGLPDEAAEVYLPLASGEYNTNFIFTHPLTDQKLVLRVNMGSQMHLDSQIEYEAHALRLLSRGRGEHHRTPRLYYTDNSRRYIANGILVMEYLPGRYPSYEDEDDMTAVMECLADIHSIPVPDGEIICGEPDTVSRDTVKLIAPLNGIDAILDECESMLSVYSSSPLAAPAVKIRLRRLMDAGHEIASSLTDMKPPCRCCINTELNSTNFLIEEQYPGSSRACSTTEQSRDSVCSGTFSNAEQTQDSICSEYVSIAERSIGSACSGDVLSSERTLNGNNGRYARLVDWEKPLYGDPAQDLGHLLAPTTTFWKTDTVLGRDRADDLIGVYLEAADGRFCTDGIRERTHLYADVTCLRGLTWCAMAWTEYQDPARPITNESTRKKLDEYLSDDFLKMIEDRLLAR